LIVAAALLICCWIVAALVVGCFAAWWLAAMLYYGNGPGDVFKRWRESVTGFVGEQFECFWCCALWAGLAIAPLALLAWPVLVPLAFAGAAILLTHGGRIVWREMTE